MLRSFRSPADRCLVEALRDPRGALHAYPEVGLERLFERAERHGLLGVVHDAVVRAEIAVPKGVGRGIIARELAREADHLAQLIMLRRIDEVLHAAGLAGVLLKGALLAQRLYERPSTRPSTDIDLLVDEEAVDASMRALATIGYVQTTHPRERHFEKRGHHVHLVHEGAPTLELHFHALRGFGGTLRSAPLLGRSEPYAGFQAVRVLAPTDELVYLSVHAAAHRFMRLGWLYDVLLLVQKLTPDKITGALEDARRLGMIRPTLLALDLVATLFGWRNPVGVRLGGPRHTLAKAITEEPPSAIARSATRLAYTLALCNDLGAVRRYLRDTLEDRFELLTSSE